MFQRLCRRKHLWGWAVLSVGALSSAQVYAQTTGDATSWGGLSLMAMVWVLIPAGALLLPKLLERRLVALMFKRSEAMKLAQNDAASPNEVDSHSSLEIVEVHSEAEIPGAAEAREHYSARWIALFRKALWCDVGVALAYAVLTGAAIATTDVASDVAWVGPFLGVLYLIFALVRYRLYFPKFHTGDGQIGAPVDDMAKFALSAARNAAAGPIGWIMLFVSSLLTLTMPRLRIWMTGVFVLLSLLFASAMFDEGSIAVGSMLVAAALVHVGVTAWFSRELQRHPGLKLLVLRVFGVDDKATFTFGSVLAVWGFFGNYFTIIDPSYWRHANKLWSIATLLRVLGTLALLGVVFSSTSELLPLRAAGADSVALAVAGLLVLGAIVVVAYRTVDAQCIRSREHLHQVLLRLDNRPRGLDVAFRNLMVPCHDNTWKIAVAEFVQHSHVVLMDLRGFSESREGCKFEVNFLLDVLPVERVVFLIDRSNDRELVGRLLANCWRELNVSSPNLGKPAPQAKLYAAGQEDEADVQGLLDLLVTVAGTTARERAPRTG